MSAEDVRNAAEQVARDAYGRLLARVSARTRDIAAAEDALAQAFIAALESWPRTGIPRVPEAWLLTTARRAAGHALRYDAVRKAADPTLLILAEETSSAEASGFPDQRLGLLFACTHPAIDPAIRTPLMLQSVLGLDSASIARAFVIPAPTMAQRLVRAKAKLRDAGIPFETPPSDQMPERLEDVLAAIYAAYGQAWDMLAGADNRHGALACEALYLATLLVALMPDEPEPKGLLALILYCEARRSARRDQCGRYVPLSLQNRSLWRFDMIEKAEGLLKAASLKGRFGRFQTEAAIQSLHVDALSHEKKAARALVALYDLLARYHPTVGVAVARAVAHGRCFDAPCGLALLDEIDDARVRDYQPYWAAKFHLARGCRPAHEVAQSRQRAIELSTDQAIVGYLQAL